METWRQVLDQKIGRSPLLSFLLSSLTKGAREGRRRSRLRRTFAAHLEAILCIDHQSTCGFPFPEAPTLST